MTCMFKKIYSGLIRLPESPRALMVLLAFAAFLMGTLFIARLNADLNYDGEIYINAAMRLAKGLYKEGLAIYPMPALSLIISTLNALIGNWIISGRAIALVSMLLTVIPLYFLARRLFNSHAAFWCCLCYILLPETLNLSNSVLRDPPFILLFTLAVYFGIVALQTNRVVALLFSAFWGAISTIFRIEGLIIFPIGLFAIIGMAFCSHERSVKILRMSLFWLSIWMLFIGGSWFFINVFGINRLNRYADWKYFFDAALQGALFKNYNRITEQLFLIRESSSFRGVGLHVAEVGSIYLPLLYLIGIFHHMVAIILPHNLIPLTYGFVRSQYQPSHLFTISIVIGLLTLAFGFFIRLEVLVKRYLMMPSLLILPWVGFGIHWIIQRFQHKKFGQAAIVTVILLIFFVPSAKFQKYFINEDNLAIKTSEWIKKQNQFIGSTIIFNDQIIKFHADIQLGDYPGLKTLLHLVPADRDFSELIEFAERNRADVLVIRYKQKETGHIPYFKGFKEIKEFNYKKKVVKIYLRA